MLSPPSAKASQRTGDALVEELQRLPVQNATALRILSMLEDPDVPLAGLAPLIQADPSLAARVLKLANSSFFGLRSEIADIERGIMVIGLGTVRTFTLAAAFDLFADRGANVPGDFWAHAVQAAAGSMSLARRLGLPTGDAFSAGLLHDLGMALLFRLDPARYEAACLAPAPSDAEVPALERATFGTDHAEAAAVALRACRFPRVLTEAIAAHHEPVRKRRLGRSDLAAVIAVGEHLGTTVARAAAGDGSDEPSDTTLELLDAVALTAADHPALVASIEVALGEIGQLVG